MFISEIYQFVGLRRACDNRNARADADCLVHAESRVPGTDPVQAIQVFHLPKVGEIV